MLILLLVSACGREGTGGFKLPADTATPEQKQKISEALEMIQGDLDANGVKHDLTRVPVIVAKLEDPNVQGRCYRTVEGKGLAIVLTPDLMNQGSYDENLHPWYLTVLLHEIGHCYFNREHETEVLALGGQELVFPVRRTEKSLEYTMAWISPSVMNIHAERLMFKDLLGYYVREIAGLDRISTWDELSSYVHVTVRETQR